MDSTTENSAPLNQLGKSAASMMGHPFQIVWLPGPKQPYNKFTKGESGFILRLDLPGAPPSRINLLKIPPDRINFQAVAPKKDGFPIDEPDRVYAGNVRLNRYPNDISVRTRRCNGCLFMFFVEADGEVYRLVPATPPTLDPPPTSPVSQESNKDEGSSPVKSIDDLVDWISGTNLNPTNSTGKSESRKTSSRKSRKGSWKSKNGKKSSKKSTDKAEGFANIEFGESPSNQSAEGSANHELGESLSSQSVEEGSANLESGEGPSNQSPEDAGTVGSSSSSTTDEVHEDGEAWMVSYIKRSVLLLYGIDPPKDEPPPVTTDTAKSSHEEPEIAIGAIKGFCHHGWMCECHQCDHHGIYLRTWTITEDVLISNNELQIKGPREVCVKKVVKEEGGGYSLYMRVDLPGMEPHLRVTVQRERSIIVHGLPQPEEHYKKGGRNYLFFVQLRCTCCRFNQLNQEHENGVLWMSCKIIRKTRTS